MAYVNRPWASSITSSIEKASASEAGLEQVHKLARNYVASLDLGGPMKLTISPDRDHDTKPGETGREKYLLWVKNWKVFYKNLSVLIRKYKTDGRGYICDDHIRHNENMFRLKETAQVLLNARYNAKLASWALKQRNWTNQR